MSERRRFRFSLRTLVLFVAVCGSGYGLWAHWEPWQEAFNFIGSGVFSAEFSADGKTVRTFCATESDGALLVLYDATDGKWLEGQDRHVVDSVVSVSVLQQDRWKTQSGRWIPFEPLAANLSLDGFRFLAVDERDIVHIYDLRHPYQWYGIFHLPEFWLTLALTLALLWSVRRDWKGLRLA